MLDKNGKITGRRQSLKKNTNHYDKNLRQLDLSKTGMEIKEGKIKARKTLNEDIEGGLDKTGKKSADANI